MADRTPPGRSRLPSGVLTALACAVLLIGAFVLTTSTTVMPARERWAALSTFGVLTVLYTLPGSPELYDVLGRTVRRDPRALGSLLLVIPVLYASYSLSVDAFHWSGLLSAMALVGLPALLFAQSRRQRVPTLFDVVAGLYLLLSLMLGLLPELPLPQQGGVVGFFWLSAAPLLLVLLAYRSWSGLGFTWFISWSDLRTALLWAGLVLLVLAPLALVAGLAQVGGATPSYVAPVLDEIILAVFLYFLVALPQEILFRGLIQNGITRFAEAKLWRGPGSSERRGLLRPEFIGLLTAALIFAGSYLYNPIARPDTALLVGLAGLGYGWVYQQTGKVTASAITHMLVVWAWTLLLT